ncbi:MAG TPA: hypothetical protein VMS60_15080 [Solirubrobacterales bacterium]|nr:hypothetical protein [Solirubrobacterales bacterium]
MLIPYSGPAAKSAAWPSVSAITTALPASSSGANSADSTWGMAPPSVRPPEIA